MTTASVELPTAIAELLVTDGEGGAAGREAGSESPSMAALAACLTSIFGCGSGGILEAPVWGRRPEEVEAEMAVEDRSESGGEFILEATGRGASSGYKTPDVC